MTLKLSFEATTSGFDKVTKALQDSQRLAESNARAFDELNKAKGTLGRTETEFKGSENLKTTTASIKDMVTAFDALTKSNTGLSGFVGMFSGLNKELIDFSKSGANSIIKGMSSQIDILKRSISEATEAMSRSRKEAEQHRSAGRIKEALESETISAEFGSAAGARTNLLNQLRIQYALRAPIGTLMSGMGGGGGRDGPFAGLAGMGPSIGGIAGTAGAAFAGTYLAGKLANGAVSMLQSGERGDIARFNREVSTAQEAEQGNVARQFMLNRGIGREAQFDRGNLGFLERGFERMGATAEFVTSLGQKGIEEINEERRQKYKRLDAINNLELNQGFGNLKSLYEDPNFYRVQRTRGDEQARDLIKRFQESQPGLSESGLTAAQVTRLLPSMEMFGGVRRLNGPGMGPYRDPYNMNGFIERSQRSFGVSDQIQQQLQQQRFYRPNTGRELATSVGLVDQQSNLQVQNMLLEEGYNVSNQGLPFQGVSAATAITPIASTFRGIGVDVDDQTKAQAAIGANRFQRGKIGQFGSLQSYGEEAALMRLGISNPVEIQLYLDLISKGQSEKAAELLQKRTGKDINGIRKSMEAPLMRTNEIATRLAGGDKKLPDGSTLNEFYQKNLNVSLSAYGQGGLTPTGLGLDASVKAGPLFGGVSGTSPTGIPLLAAGAQPLEAAASDKFTTAQAGQEGALMKGVQDISKALGTTFMDAVTKAIGEGFQAMGDKIRQSTEHVKAGIEEAGKDNQGTKPANAPYFSGLGSLPPAGVLSPTTGR